MTTLQLFNSYVFNGKIRPTAIGYVFHDKTVITTELFTYVRERNRSLRALMRAIRSFFHNAPT